MGIVRSAIVTASVLAEGRRSPAKALGWRHPLALIHDLHHAGV